MLFDSAPSKERLFLFLGAVSGFLAVAFGAFGEHALWERLSSDRLAIFETAARYQMFHSLALVMTGLVVTRRIGRAAPAAGWLFAVGIVLFCGSLYLLALSGARWWGAVTPLGGLAWLAAWALLAFSGMRARLQVAAVEEPRIEGPGD
ncbi:MAG TPA: DUF423 domain-containing protein [bacterium]|nr:DUF423 domain-containing protein [bacterium]